MIDPMKKLFLPLAVLLLSATAAIAGSKIYSVVIHSTDQPYSFVIPASRVMKISNFTHSGDSSTQPGRIFVFQGPQPLPGIEIMLSDLSANSHIAHEDVSIAGPTVIYIQPLPNETLFLSYLWSSN
jgi:hypothetical protein